jgi:hypothetical protein
MGIKISTNGAMMYNMYNNSCAVITPGKQAVGIAVSPSETKRYSIDY